MITCLDFVRSIGVENFKKCIESHFDHIMALYSIVGQYKIETADVSFDEKSILVNMKMDIVPDDVQRVTVINIYGNPFELEIKDISKNSMQVEMRPCT